MKLKIRRTLRNPIILMTPVVLVLAYGWHVYSVAGQNLSLPSAGQNLLGEAPWQGSKSGQLTYKLHPATVFPVGPSRQLTVTAYQSGNASLSSPRLPVHPGLKYLFKSYYRSTIPVTLLARIWYQDHTEKLIRIDDCPAATGKATASHAFDSGSQISSIQYVFQVAGNGSLTLSNPYLEPNPNVQIASTARPAANLIANPKLAPGDYSLPDQWSTFASGNNAATFSYLEQGAAPYLAVQIQHYQGGQAKWQYPAQPVNPFMSYVFSVEYHASTFSDVVAEYNLAGGGKQFATIATLAPTATWTETTAGFQAPAGATDLFVSVILAKNGTLVTRSYDLTGAPSNVAWSAPLVSITFDKGTAADAEVAAALLHKNKLTATFYVNPATIETPGYMSALDLEGLESTGNEIASAGYYHEDLTTVSVSRLKYDLQVGKGYLAKAGYRPTDLAPPDGKTDPQVSWFARRYYATLRSTQTGINTAANFDPYNLLIMPVSPDTTPAQIKTVLDQTKQAHGWLILAFNQITPGLQQQLAAVTAGQIAVKTIDQAVPVLNNPSPQPLPQLTIK